MPGTTPSQPGWYPDGDGGERWYDGNGWTDHVRGASAGKPSQEPPNEATVVVPTTPTGELTPPPQWNQLAAPQLGVGRGMRIAMAVGAVALLIAVAVVAGFVLLGGDDAKDTSKDDASQTGSVEPTDKAPSSLDLPTIDPSDFPTGVPTDLPTINPSDLPDLPDRPSGFPTNFPDLPSNFPTDPEGWEDWFSDYLEQVNP
ncbi:DUF2510 domain-containing protein [Nocardioides sp. WS12]|uniref:DUF2510 domain-containing protein n=1 Tax=Nocardioides sp. WS12 TaxID=2486272 RepID=UPI0015F885B8|nr:DUF2510 domain-containing protein [Nocardioides sp. WS12]